ncbi:MAG: hypothetical protein ABII79_13800 [bacterium]
MIRMQMIILLLIWFGGRTLVFGVETEPSTAVRDTLVAADEGRPPYVISIGHRKISQGTIEDTIGVRLKSGSRELAAFDLKLALSSRLINIDTVLPGEIPDSCGWELFRARRLENTPDTDFPQQVWRIVALARTSPSGDGPNCLGLDRDASLLRLVISSPPLAMVPDTVIEIFFFWENCSDNTIAGPDGDTLAVSVAVFDNQDGNNQEELADFPCRTGTPRHCIDPTVRNQPQRWINFHNGAVEFRFDFGQSGADTSDTTDR